MISSTDLILHEDLILSMWFIFNESIIEVLSQLNDLWENFDLLKRGSQQKRGGQKDGEFQHSQRNCNDELIKHQDYVRRKIEPIL